MKDEFSPRDPIAVANYVIDYTNNHSKPITNLKLQKILFYLQAAFLVEYDTPLMETKFSRWQYGPVSKDVYFSFNDNGASNIKSKAKILNFDTFEVDEPLLKIDSRYKIKVDEYIEKLADYSASNLVQHTHNQSIWSDFKTSISNRNAPDYTDSEIKEYFSENKDQQLWMTQITNQ